MPNDNDPTPASNAQWGGRFAAGPSAIMRDINASIGFDQRLWRQDIRGSLAHAAMLARAGIIGAEDAAAIAQGLGAIGAQIESGGFAFTEALEDIHMNIEARLTDAIGEPGKRLHTARSRNDQVATDCPAVGAGRHRRVVGPACRAYARHGGACGRTCG